MELEAIIHLMYEMRSVETRSKRERKKKHFMPTLPYVRKFPSMILGKIACTYMYLITV